VYRGRPAGDTQKCFFTKIMDHRVHRDDSIIEMNY
jgi:hypothetical protein